VNAVLLLKRAAAALLPVGAPFLLGIPLRRAVPLEASLMGFLGMGIAATQGFPISLGFLVGSSLYGVGLAIYGAYTGDKPMPLEGEISRMTRAEGGVKRQLRAALATLLSAPWLVGNLLFWGGLVEEEPLRALIGEALAIGGFFLVAPQVEALKEEGPEKGR
jgi:hypothetical protein